MNDKGRYRAARAAKKRQSIQIYETHNKQKTRYREGIKKTIWGWGAPASSQMYYMTTFLALGYTWPFRPLKPSPRRISIMLGAFGQKKVVHIGLKALSQKCVMYVQSSV